MAESPIVDEDTADALGGDIVGKQTGSSSTLSPYVGEYVTEDVLAQGKAAADMPYEAYTGPLTAGESELQQDAFAGIAGLTLPDDQMGVFTPTSFTQADLSAYMNPYITNVLDNTIRDLRKEAEIKRLENAARMTAAGSYGGSRQAVLEGAFDEALIRQLGDVLDTGYSTAYDKGLAQFNLEQDRGASAQEAANIYGMNVIDKLAELGGIQRGITAEGVAADKAQFEEERDYPLKTAQYKASLLEGLPLATQEYTYATPNELSKALGFSGGIMDLYESLFGGDDAQKNLTDLEKALDKIGYEIVDNEIKKKTA
tara:strand:- start:4035 stop:4973 length:939 start_codon:yes stop_codon:yes gene_type:complete